MTWALIGLAGVLAASIGVLAGAAWWFGKQAVSATSKLATKAEETLSVKAQLLELGAQQRQTHEILTNVQKERDRLDRVRTLADQRIAELHDMLVACSSSADPTAAAAGVRAALKRLRDLAKEVPDVPTDATTDHD